MLGRRLHHTDFGTGKHSEPGNPIFAEHAGKLGPDFVARSCVACHVNNGRALPPKEGAPMLQTVVKVGAGAASELMQRVLTGDTEKRMPLGSEALGLTPKGYLQSDTAKILALVLFALLGTVMLWVGSRKTPAENGTAPGGMRDEG